MKKRRQYSAFLISLTLIAILFAAGCNELQKNVQAPDDITFIVCSDTHYGVSDTIAKANQETIKYINAIEGISYPDSVRGHLVAKPLGVIVCGDLTESAKPDQWEAFVKDFEIDGKGGVKFPVYEGIGNHDTDLKGAVRNGIIQRNKIRKNLTMVSDNGMHYSWDFGNIHLVQLNLYPGDIRDKQGKLDSDWNTPDYSLAFLKKDLAKNVGNSNRPVILFQHYAFDEGFTMDWGWWSHNEVDNYYEAIKNYNIVGIFFGHTHAFKIDKLNEIDLYNEAALQRDPNEGEFVVVSIKDDEMIVGHRFIDHWGQVIKKKITGNEK